MTLRCSRSVSDGTKNAGKRSAAATMQNANRRSVLMLLIYAMNFRMSSDSDSVLGLPRIRREHMEETHLVDEIPFALLGGRSGRTFCSGPSCQNYTSAKSVPVDQATCIPCLHEAARRADRDIALGDADAWKRRLNVLARINTLMRASRIDTVREQLHSAFDEAWASIGKDRQSPKEPRVHLMNSARSERLYREAWCPASVSVSNPRLVISRYVAHATCLECLNLALDHAVRNNDTAMASELMNRRKVLPNHEQRRKARREAERTAKVSGFPERSLAEVRKWATDEMPAEFSNFSAKRRAADVLYLLDEVARLELDLAAEKIGRANDRFRSAVDPAIDSLRIAINKEASQTTALSELDDAYARFNATLDKGSVSPEFAKAEFEAAVTRIEARMRLTNRA